MKNLIAIILVLYSMNSIANYTQQPQDLLIGEVMAIAYSGFRAGQHPDRGNGAINPSKAEILEDLQILEKHGFRLIRMYDSGINSRHTLELIKEHNIDIKVVMGAWISAELSNHRGCSWCVEPIPQSELTANTKENIAEINRLITLANEYPEIIIAVNVGNEALVDWTDHLVSVDSMIQYVRNVKAAISQPVTVAENYFWWAKKGQELASELDFIGVHTYPIWEGRGIDKGLPFTIENIEMVRQALPESKIAIFEAGWATTAIEFGERANEQDQVTYFTQLSEWGQQTNTTIFFFEAFDEPWKGDPANSLGAEKHWGIFFESRKPKLLMQQ